MNCSDVEDNISDYLEGDLPAGLVADMDRHFGSCTSCRGLLAGVREIRLLRTDLPFYSAPPWLAGRIVASTPAIVREGWRDTLAGAWNWVCAPRMAMTLFASVLVFGWSVRLMGFSADASILIRDPAAAYYSAEGLLYDVYDGAIRSWYRSRIAEELYCRIEQLKEIA